MSARVLPRDEWGRLEGNGPCDLAPLTPGAKVVAVEVDGRIVAALGVMPMVHFEGAWVDPAHRSAGVVRGLVRKAFDVAGCPWIVAGSADERMEKVLTRLGAHRIDASFWILGKEE